MAKFFKFLLGVLLGAAFAVAVVILLTPTSGKELKAKAKERIDYIRTEVEKAREEKRKAMEAQLELLRQPK